MKLARKVTETTVREYDADDNLISEITKVTTARFKPEPDRVVGFSKPFEQAK